MNESEGFREVRVWWSSAVAHAGSGEDRISGKARGLLRPGTGSVLLRYCEPEAAGTRVETELEWGRCGAGWWCRLTRRGDVRTAFRLVPGHREAGWYETPYGRLPLEVWTRAVEVSGAEERWRIRLQYDICWAGEPVSRVSVNLAVFGAEGRG